MRLLDTQWVGGVQRQLCESDHGGMEENIATHSFSRNRNLASGRWCWNWIAEQLHKSIYGIDLVTAPGVYLVGLQPVHWTTTFGPMSSCLKSCRRTYPMFEPWGLSPVSMRVSWPGQTLVVTQEPGYG